MPAKSVAHKDMARSVFIALVDRWDIKDAAGAETLARTAWQIAEAYFEIERQQVSAGPARNPRPDLMISPSDL